MIDDQKYILEVCANSIQSAITAQKGGADRIELCSSISEGGVTPSIATIEETRARIDIDLFILIRPRAGNFVYDSREYEIMKRDISHSRKLACQGIVTGVLTETGEIDEERNKELVAITKNLGMEITFHRAIDRTKDILQSTYKIVEMGFDRILTSGGYSQAIDGYSNIQEMQRLFGNKIKIMAGSGITPDNISEIALKTEVTEFHGTFSSKIKDENIYQNPNISDGNSIFQTNLEKVLKARALLDNLENYK